MALIKIADNNWIYNVAGVVIGTSIFVVPISLIYYYFTDQLAATTATAYGTIIGAIANLFLVLATWGYLGEVRKQVNIMAEDGLGRAIREERESRSYTMINLIAPLYFSKTDDLLFGMNRRYSRTHAYDSEAKGFFEFWGPIMASMHLAPPSLFFALENFLDARDAYWDTFDENLTQTLESERRIGRFNDTRSALSIEIDIAYKDLKGKIAAPNIPTK